MDSSSSVNEPSIFYTVWDEAYGAITTPASYVKRAVQPWTRSLGYLTIIVTMMSLIHLAYYAIVLAPRLDQAATWLSENIPAFQFTAGQLSLAEEKTYTFSDDNQYFVRIDQNETIADAKIDAFYQIGLVAAQDGLMFKNDTELKSYKYPELGLSDQTFSGSILASWISAVRAWLYPLVAILVFGYLFLSKILVTLIIAFFAWLFTGLNLRFVHLWSIAIYALTPAAMIAYIAFMFQAPALLSTLVLLAYFVLGVGEYRRFLALKNN